MKNKVVILLKSEQRIFHTSDLSLLWSITNKNTLYTTIKRYVQKGILHKIFKGMYSTITPADLNPLQVIVGAMHRYGYLTTESVLVKEGLIHQEIKYVTFVSDISKNFSVLGYDCKIRKLDNRFLFNNAGVKTVNGIKTACVERAIADLLYFNPNYFFDNQERIDWKKVKQFQKEVY